MKIEETSENIIHFKVRTFIALVGSLVVGTNIVNSVLHRISDNEATIEYNAEAEERRRQHLEDKLNYIAEIKELTKELKKCEKGE